MLVYLKDFGLEMEVSLSSHARKRLEERHDSLTNYDIESALCAILELPETADLLINEVKIGEKLIVRGLLDNIKILVGVGAKELEVITILKNNYSRNAEYQILDVGFGTASLSKGACRFA